MGPHNRPSPNHSVRPRAVDMLILHYTGMVSCAAALERLCDPTAKVSAHYLVDEDGTSYRMVPEERCAWHAGRASWHGDTDINERSIGIELVNPGHEFGYRAFPEVQMTAMTALAQDIVVRHSIPSARVLGHADVAPERRADPGELFDWRGLASAGIGLWPEASAAQPAGDGDIGDVQRQLRAIGYAVGQPGAADPATHAAIVAFQRHFVQTRTDGVVDRRTAAQLEGIVNLIA